MNGQTDDFLPEDYAFTAGLLRQHTKDDRADLFRATCSNNLNIILAALEKAAEDDWRPIETAPRDESKFIAWDGWQMFLASWMRGKYLATFGRGENNRMNSEPTYWIPLPEPPNAK